MRLQTFFVALVSLAVGINAYWLEEIKHQGLAPFGGDGYKVFRNVKDFGAKGDGTSDDTEAIMNALNDGGNRCMKDCASSTETPAIVYFPGGTYLVSSSIVAPYMTQMIGDPTNIPTLKAAAQFEGFGIIDGNPYYSEDPNWITTNIFFRQVANFIIDTTAIAPATAATGMHWPSSQATSLMNIQFNMPETDDTVHVGLFIENGSGGFMRNLTFNGGASGASIGNQQYTMIDFTFNKCKTAITQIWNWGWTYIGLSINDCDVGIDMSAGYDGDALEVGGMTILDSSFKNVANGIRQARTESTKPATAGGLILENVSFENSPVAVSDANNGTVLAGGSTIAAWGQGHRYTPDGPSTFSDTIEANKRPAGLVKGDVYYTQQKPWYEDLDVGSIASVRDAGAKGDGTTDDTAALQKAIDDAASANKVLFLDYGLYMVTDTITVPPGAKIFGESYPAIMGSGKAFQDMNSPKAVFKIGASAGQTGAVELSNFRVGTKGPAPGAVVIEYNLASTDTPSHVWDVHTTIGGYAGSEFQVEQCLKQPGSSEVPEKCYAAYMAVHAVPESSGLYLENNWIWVSDHDIEDFNNTQITIFGGRGIYIESTEGNFWLIGGGSEHFDLYNYQFANTKNIFGSMFQSESPYYQPQPDTTMVFPVNADLKDPDFATSCNGVEGNCKNSWGLRVVDSSDIFVYGAGHYSFFNNYDTSCNTFESGSNCQARIVSMEGENSNINIYGLNTVGTLNMVTQDGKDIAKYEDNIGTFAANIMLFRSG